MARLNIFQKTQRLWDTIHPYNAAQAAALAVDFDDAAIESAFNAAIDDLRLGVFAVHANAYCIERPAPVRLHAIETSLADHVGSEMNRPFDPSVSFPFRPFVCREGGRRVIGVVYQHWVADSVSIRMLMRQWIFRLIGRAAPSPVRLPDGGLWRTFGGDRAGWSLTAELARQFGMASRMKKMRRADAQGFKSGDSAVLAVTETGWPLRLRAAARQRGATVGDLFLAAAADAVAKFGMNIAAPARNDLAMGTIVDLRAQSALSNDVFGLYLGFTITPYAAGELLSFDAILRRTAAHRRTNLKQHAAEASQVRMGLGYALAKLFGRDWLQAFYRKRFPLAGGLSSVNLSADWPGELFPRVIADYWRISPPGPFMPIVFTPTTLSDRLTVCCTYRTGLYATNAAQQVLAAFVERLREVASGARVR